MKTDADTTKDRSRDGDSSFGWLEDSDESAGSDSVDQLRPAVPSSMVTYSTEALPRSLSIPRRPGKTATAMPLWPCQLLPRAKLPHRRR